MEIVVRIEAIPFAEPTMAKRTASKKKRGRPAQPEAAYRLAAEQLRKRIKAGEFPSGSVLPSLRSLARDLKVGERVIRAALEVLKREDRIKVNARRRMVVKWPEGAITTTDGIILEIAGANLHSLLVNPAEAALQLGIEFGAGDLWTPLLIAHDEHLRNALPDDLLQHSLTGILLLGMFTNRILKKYERLNVPVVLVDRPGDAWNIHSVSVANEQSAYEATMQLVQLGHTRIAFIRFVQMNLREIDPDSIERQKGFARACKEAGLRFNKQWIFNSFPKDDAASPSIQAILRAKPRFTALVAVDNGRAGLVVEAARAQGRTVPRDLSVVSFQAADTIAPKFTGPATDFFNLGRRAALLLGRPRRPAIHERVATVWADGNSIAAPR